MQNTYNYASYASIAPGEGNSADRMENLPEVMRIISDEDAKKHLPANALAAEEYRRHRTAGDAPSIALEKTMSLWRELWGGGAYVPHRRM